MNANHDSIHIRPARPEDLAAAVQLLEQARLPVAGVPESFDRFVIAEVAGRIVGIAGLEVHGTDGLLRSVAVHEDWRGSGIGGALTAAILELSAREGLSSVYLLTQTAEAFFPRHGFRRISRDEASENVRDSAEFRDLCPTSSAVMVRRMSGVVQPLEL